MTRRCLSSGDGCIGIGLARVKAHCVAADRARSAGDGAGLQAAKRAAREERRKASHETRRRFNQLQARKAGRTGIEGQLAFGPPQLP